MKKINDIDVHMMMGLWSSGNDIKHIASLMNEQENTIRYHLRKNGIDVEDDPYPLVGKSYKDYADEEDDKLRRKQATCKHPSMRCSVCHVFSNNLENEAILKIHVDRIAFLENLLKANNILF